MCGIVGLIDKKDKIGDKRREEVVRIMLDFISHRGGDSMGIVSHKNTTIGHTRLSIVDITHQADQPFVNDIGILSYNGEIYNHQSLRNRYCDRRKIESTSDTATLFELLQLSSIDSVLRMVNGMYAFSFLDIKKETLFLALDKIAIKPLYYVETPEYFAWASEIKAFKALPGFVFTMNSEVLFEHLVFRYVSGAQTLFRDIYKIQAGEFLEYSLDSNMYSKNKYFDLKKSSPGRYDIETILTESIKVHLMGDVPVGVQLSGGIDSSLVSYIAQKNSANIMFSFSIGLKDSGWNEFEYSDAVAAKLGTIHQKILFTKEDFVKNLEKITYHLDEPITHPNTIPIYLLAKFARRYTKVLLTGEGADEVFLGYRRYLKKSTFMDDKLLLSNSFSTPEIVLSVLKKTDYSLSEREKLIQKTNNLSYQDKLSFYDIFTYLPNVLIRQDKACMAANIENRVPFLYESVVQAGFNLDLKIGEMEGKTYIKKIASKYYPHDFVTRQKCGFGLPVSEWIRDKDCLLPYLQALRSSQFVSEYFNEEVIDVLINSHLNGTKDYSAILFSLIGLYVWYNVFCKTPAVFLQE